MRFWDNANLSKIITSWFKHNGIFVKKTSYIQKLIYYYMAAICKVFFQSIAANKHTIVTTYFLI